MLQSLPAGHPRLCLQPNTRFVVKQNLSDSWYWHLIELLLQSLKLLFHVNLLLRDWHVDLAKKKRQKKHLKTCRR